MFTSKMKFADLLLLNNSLIHTLSRFGIGLGFGDKSVDEVCRQHNVSTDFFLLLSNVYTFEDYLPDKATLAQIDMNEMILYLLASHDYYLNNRLLDIEQHMKIISCACAASNGAVLQRFFTEYKEEVIKHFRYEEEIVFPYIRLLLRGEQSEAYNIHQFEENHSNIEDKLADLVSILMKYLPSNICQAERMAVLSDIFVLSADLNKHSLIEDKILVPWVENLEAYGR